MFRALTALSAQIGYIVTCMPRKLILQQTYRQMAEPGFEARSFRHPIKYCNHSTTEADSIMMMIMAICTERFQNKSPLEQRYVWCSLARAGVLASEG